MITTLAKLRPEHADAPHSVSWSESAYACAPTGLRLMQLVASGDAGAQREFLHRFSPRVLRIARIFAAPGVDADDAAQLSLLEILRSAEHFRIATSLERWVDRIAVRTTLRLARRERTRRHLLMRWLTPDALPWGARAESTQSDRGGLDQLLDKLTPARRRALILRHVFEYSVDEIADLTGVPRGTVRDRLVVGRKQLRRAIAGKRRT